MTHRSLRSLLLIATLGAAALLAGPPAALGQAGVVLRGVAYDSLRSRPLPGALITIEALGRAAFSDSAGGFVFDSVPPGTYDLVLEHEYLDAIGMGESRVSVTVPGDGRPVRVASPSFTTVWRRVCGTRPPSDSGFVHGVVHDARDRTPVPLAEVQAGWVDVGFDRRSGVSQERLGGSVTTDGRGRYTICGVPNGVQLQLRARQGEATTDVIEVFHVEPGVTRRDFLLPALKDSALRGVARGIVLGATGAPAPNALLRVADLREVRTDDRGRFVLSGVPIGTRSVIVRAIGADPIRAILDVPWADTVYVEIPLRNIASLTPVEVIGSEVQRKFLEDLDRRRTLGVAKFVDSTRAVQFASVQSALTAHTVARMRANGSITLGPRNCSPGLWIDRRYVKSADAQGEMRLFNMARVGTLEVYERGDRIPLEFTPPVPDRTDCIVVIWTKAMFP